MELFQTKYGVHGTKYKDDIFSWVEAKQYSSRILKANESKNAFLQHFIESSLKLWNSTVKCCYSVV